MKFRPEPPRRTGLRDVTVCAVDCAAPSLAASAIARCIERCDFGDAILLSDVAPPSLSADIRHVPIPPLSSRDGYSSFMLLELAHYVSTPYVLVVQWDGFVLDESAWTDDFLAFDYIGAKWAWHAARRVGNGGFSLRSKRLLEATATIAPASLDGRGEDEVICRVIPGRLEASFGIRFAPEAVADQFAYERTVSDRPSFGFHGMFNLWRHMDDDALAGIAANVAAATVRSREFAECLIACCAQRRFVAMRALYARLHSEVGSDKIGRHFAALKHPIGLVQALIAICEPLIQEYRQLAVD